MNQFAKNAIYNYGNNLISGNNIPLSKTNDAIGIYLYYSKPF